MLELLHSEYSVKAAQTLKSQQAKCFDMLLRDFILIKSDLFNRPLLDHQLVLNYQHLEP